MKRGSKVDSPIAAVVAAVVLLLLAPAPLRAEDPAPDPNRPDQVRETKVEETIDGLDQRLRILERKREIEQEQAAEKAKQTPAAGAGKEGFSVKSADGNFLLRFRWILMVDGRFFGDDRRTPSASTFLIRTARPILEATVYKYFDFRIVPDFGDGKTTLQDAYAEARIVPALRIRAGKSKSPFGIERLQSETDTLFAERALPNNLVPNRDIGLQIHGEVAGGVFAYAGGVFNGVADGGSADGDADDGKDAEARVFFHPFRKTSIEALRGFGLGAAATRGSPNGTPTAPGLPTYKSAGQRDIFKYLSNKTPTAANTTVADGCRTRFSPQAYYYWRRGGLIAEYVRTAQDVRREPDPNGPALTGTITNRAWQVAGSFLLTGEKATYRSVTPRKPIGVQGGGWGAVEITGRYGRLSIDEDAFGDVADPNSPFADPNFNVGAASAWAAGVNWYLNSAVKMMLDYERTHFTRIPTLDRRETEKTLFFRFQMAF